MLLRHLAAAASEAVLMGLLAVAQAGENTLPSRGKAYAGSIELEVDATDLDRRILRAHEALPVRPGALTLYYPKWIQAHHAPRGLIETFAGLTVRGNGQRIDWVRDPLNVYAFSLTVPPGVTRLELEFQYMTAQNKDMGRITMTPEMLAVQWETALLYPAGYDASLISFRASVKLPSGWQYATALTTERREGDMVRFQSTTLETLADSPLFAGRYFSRVDLDPGAKAPVYLDIFADTPEELEMTPEQLAAHRKMVREAVAVFGSRHFDQYDFLFGISDNFGDVGLEHHRSSEDVLGTGYFKDDKKTLSRRALLPHEFTHSWNGKFRRPADQLTPDLNAPMKNDLLWVYEGQTNFWDLVLAARSGIWSAEIARDALAARVAVLQDKRPGRAWRDLQDTNHQPIITPRRPLGWASWQRSEDYYSEGGLIWLDVDTKLRELTHEQRSLDDFAAAFFGVKNGSYVPLGYTFDDIVNTLKGLAAFDWAAFLRERLESNQPSAPLQGLERAGWRLVYKEEPTDYFRKVGELNDQQDFGYSIGLVLGKEGKLAEVVWGSPAFKAGLSTAYTLIAVNGRAYKPELLKQAIQDAKSKSTPLVLLVKNFDRYTSVSLDYRGGLRYPQLERIENSVDRLAAILRPRTP